MRALQTLISFAELLSLGFATIGPRATLLAIGGQLVADAMRALHVTPRRFQHANPA